MAKRIAMGPIDSDHKPLDAQYSISKPQVVQDAAQPDQPQLPPPLPNTSSRPLSDIRELSEPSVIDSIFHRPDKSLHYNLSAPKFNSLRARGSIKRTSSAKSSRQPQRLVHARSQSTDNGSSSYSSTPEQTSFYSIPHSSVPQRSSSQGHAHQRTRKSQPRKPSIRAVSPPRLAKFEGFTVPNRGQGRSPVKEVGLRSDAINSDVVRRLPSKTYIRTPQPIDILEYPSYRHPRLKLELQVSAPLFVGGGSVEGQVKLTVDANARFKSRRSLGIGAISVDLLGFEDLSGSRKAIFLAIGTELIDTCHPPPSNMVEPANPLAPEEKFWTLAPSTSCLPFMISLPLDTGPPPFQSRNASIRFLLCVTALVRDAGKHYRVRTSQEICVLATYDPEKALTSLSSPLTATDELSLPRFGRCETLQITAGLHRQVWVSGSSIFADVHIANKTHKPVKRLELTLERDILCYKHAPAGNREKSASQARIFESNEQGIIARSSLNAGTQNWNGVQPYTSETRTCELELSRRHATVRCGKYFEVRFFLNVTASLSNTKLVSVQLPIILIHINSLDVVPNSLAQVAAAIEEKRIRTEHDRMKSKPRTRLHLRQHSASSPAAMAEMRRQPLYAQGRAFAAPRQQSADRQRATQEDIDRLQETLDASPRKFGRHLHGPIMKKMGSSISFGGLAMNENGGTSGRSALRSTTHTPPKAPIVQNFGRSQTKGDENFDVLRTRLRPTQSFDSVYSKMSAATTRLRPQPDNNTKPPYNFTTLQNRIEPYALGLPSAGERPGFEGSGGFISRPATNLSFREKLDRSRFEFKGVRQKASGSLKERGMNLWEQMKYRSKEREDWI